MKNKVQLITYADRLGDGNLASMTDILRTRFDGVYEGVHILPFFTPFDGADAGFDPIDHTKVDARLGDWDDIAELAKTHDIMVDAIVNHMSWQSKQFQDVLANGEDSEYYPMFLTMSSVFPTARPRRSSPASTARARACRSPTTASPARPAWCGSRSRRSRSTLTPTPPRAGNT